jgi:hypothetical protein
MRREETLSAEPMNRTDAGGRLSRKKGSELVKNGYEVGVWH